jgi:hypothetical protein
MYAHVYTFLFFLNFCPPPPPSDTVYAREHRRVICSPRKDDSTSDFSFSVFQSHPNVMAVRRSARAQVTCNGIGRTRVIRYHESSRRITNIVRRSHRNRRRCVSGFIDATMKWREYRGGHEIASKFITATVRYNTINTVRRSFIVSKRYYHFFFIFFSLIFLLLMYRVRRKCLAIKLSLAYSTPHTLI